MKKMLMAVFLVTLCNVAPLAQTARHPRIVHITEKSAIHKPPQEAPAGLETIYSNLGSSKIDLYTDSAGWEIVPPSFGGDSQFYAMQFIPKSNSYVSQVRVAVQYSGPGANQVNLSISEDAGGIPGALLAGPVTVRDLPDAGTCCSLAIASFSPVAVTGGTHYWVVADTPSTGTGSNFFGIWDFVIQGKTPPSAQFIDGSWQLNDGIALPAGEVLGTIP